MENATKALLIAASVLIVIVLIGIGIKLLSSTSDVTDQVDSVSGTMASSVFNSQFSCYFDTSTTGTQARALVSKIISNNAPNYIPGTNISLDKHQIYVNLYDKNGTQLYGHKWVPESLQIIFETIKKTSNYRIGASTGCVTNGITGGYYNGYIACITITEL